MAEYVVRDGEVVEQVATGLRLEWRAPRGQNKDDDERMGEWIARR